MKSAFVTISALACLASAGCVAGPGGSSNAANRTVAGAGIGALIGGLAGAAAGQAMTGVIVGTMAGGGIGAAVNPKVFERDRDTRGYCYSVDSNGQPILVPVDSVECKEAMARAAASQGR